MGVLCINSTEQSGKNGKEQAEQAEDKKREGVEKVGFFHGLVFFIGNGKGGTIPTSATRKAFAAVGRGFAIA